MRGLSVAPILLFALPAAAQDMRALFEQGMTAVRQAERAEGERRDELLDEAIAVFRAMLVEAPGLVRVRLELARQRWLGSVPSGPG